MKKIFNGRTIATIIACLLVVFAVHCLIESYRYKQRFYGWIEARPYSAAVDLSRPGEYTGEFVQSCSVAHDEVLYLELPEAVTGKMASQNLFDGLRYRCQIMNATGSDVLNADCWDGGLEMRVAEGLGIPVCRFSPFATGRYTLKLSVSQGAQALAGVPQRLTARYSLCGLELMPAKIMLLIGIGLGVISLVILGFTLRRRKTA